MTDFSRAHDPARRRAGRHLRRGDDAATSSSRRRCEFWAEPEDWLVLGGGSNLVVADDGIRRHRRAGRDRAASSARRDGVPRHPHRGGRAVGCGGRVRRRARPRGHRGALRDPRDRRAPARSRTSAPTGSSSATRSSRSTSSTSSRARWSRLAGRRARPRLPHQRAQARAPRRRARRSSSRCTTGAG